ncbi:MAG: hypothetical protein IJE10_08195 [Clostridia bacterium]|nr:hypothetical protein [Clostridia bacterium]
MKKIIGIVAVLCILLSMMPVVHATDSVQYIKASDFEKNLGSWTLTDGEKDTSGGGFLPFLKSPKPAVAESAKVSFELPSAGTYYLFAYTRDYEKSAGSRKFSLCVNGVTSKHTFGTHHVDGWAWEAGGSFELKKGPCTVEIVDSSRNYGRVMAVVLTTNEKFSGPETKEAMESAFKINGIQPLAEIVSFDQPTADEPEPEKEKVYTYIPANIPVQSDRPSDTIAIQLNQKYLIFQDDSKPFVENGRTLVPFRALFEALGCEVQWNDPMQTATGTRGSINISLLVGNQLANVSGNSVYLDQPAVLRNDRVMVPIRFVAEALGATVGWDDATQTVIISADIPEITKTDGYLFLPSSFSNLGSWTVGSASGGSLETGILTGGTNGAPGSATPAKAYFNVSEAGEYKVWVRSRDLPNNQPGTRFFNVAVNQEQLAPTFGTHGKDGYAWADGGVVSLKIGSNLLELLDTSDFFARCDGVLITKNLSAEPASNIGVLTKNAVVVEKQLAESSVDFPEYAKENGEIVSQTSIGNENIRMEFFVVNTSGGPIVQNRILNQKDGAWIVTKEQSEDFGFLLLSAERASLEKPLLNQQIFNTAFADDSGDAKQYYGANIYNAAKMQYLIPQSVSVSENTATLYCSDAKADVTVVLRPVGSQIEAEIQAIFKQNGYYSVGVFSGNPLPATNVLHASTEVPNDPGVIALGNYGAYSAKNASWSVLKGVRAKEQAGICMRCPAGNFRATAFYPLLGTAQSYMDANSKIQFECTILSELE